MRPISACLALLVLATQGWGQTARQSISPEDAQQLEESLKSDPNNLDSRGALLNYYFGAVKADAATAIEARRRHILWFIENAPGDDLMGTPAAAIETSGDRLADPQGHKLAAEAWRARTARKDASPAELANAAFFFKSTNHGLAIDLLELATKLEPDNRQMASFLGVEYAMAILGVTAMKNGYPVTVDPRLTDAPLAKKARAALETTKSAYLLARAGYTLSYQGSILKTTNRLSFDAAPLADAALQRAMSLEPGNDAFADLLAQHRAMQAVNEGK